MRSSQAICAVLVGISLLGAVNVAAQKVGDALTLPALTQPVVLPTPIKATKNSFFQPADFRLLGTLEVKDKEKVTFDTGTVDTAPKISGVKTEDGELGVSTSGVVQVAVFAFDRISIARGAKVEVKGDRALVLLSSGEVAIDATIDLSGKIGPRVPTSAGGTAGPGAEGGEHGAALKSNPPPPGGGDGGPACKDNGVWGRGFGAGMNKRCLGGSAGGGGAYGGAGGSASEGSPINGGNKRVFAMPGGVVYGDAALTELLGGSGGAGGSNDRGYDNASGGGGGGAIAIISLKEISIGAIGRISVAGGKGAENKACGGGGSGGAIMLVAPTIKLAEGAVLDAQGGAGGDAGPKVVDEIKPEITRRWLGSGGGGGGGRIALYSNDDFGTKGDDKIETTLPKGVTVAGGKGGTAAKDGADGSFYDGNWPELK